MTHTLNHATDMCGSVKGNIYPRPFGGPHTGLKDLHMGKVGFDGGNDEGKFWVLTD